MKNLGLSLNNLILPSVLFTIRTANEYHPMVNERTIRVILQHIREGAILIDEIEITDSIGTVATFNSKTYSLSNELFGLNPSSIL